MYLNYKKLLLVALLALIIVGSSGFYHSSRKDDLRISIIQNTSGDQFRVNITRSANQIKIVYALLDSVRNCSLQSDSAYVKTRDQFIKKVNLKKDTIEKYIGQLEKIRQRYCVYSRDSISFKPTADTTYNNLLTRISLASDKEIKNETPAKTRVVLDGVSFYYQINSRQASREFYATSPSATSHPLLYALMHHTFAVYRNKKGDTFLTKMRTNWY